MIAYIHQKPRNIIKASVGYGRKVIYLSIKSKYFFGYIICPTYPQIHKNIAGLPTTQNTLRASKTTRESVAKTLDTDRSLKHNINQVQ